MRHVIAGTPVALSRTPVWDENRDVGGKYSKESQMLTVLVVDDEPGARTMLAMALKGPDICVETASNGLDALELVRAGDYDWVVSDIKMPKLDGISLSRLIAEESPDTRVILVSAVLGEEELSDLPIAAFCSKPFDPLKIQTFILGRPQTI
jgi:CheY-like chemotaxis protein